MASLLPLLYTLAVFCVLSTVRGQVEIIVDPDIGDDSSCFSAQEARQLNESVPCATINRALGDVACGRNSSCSTASADRLRGVVIRLADGVHRLTGCVGVGQSQNVRFVAESHGGATLTCRDFPGEAGTYDNIEFCNSANVSFTGIRFENCGPVSANVFFNYTSGIVFDGCTFTNNTGAVVQIQFSSGVVFRDSVFLNNDNQAHVEPDNNETTVEELLRTVTTGGVITFFSRNADSVNLTITNCTFRTNSGNKNDVNNSRPVLLKTNGHGGAVLIRLSNVQNSMFIIKDCLFENNLAEVDGGAVFVSISQETSSNQIVFKNNTFVNNTVETASGGAIGISSFSITFDNRIVILDCRFSNNTGNAGGAVSVALYDSNVNSTTEPDSVSFIQCNFTNNFAFNEGTAVGLFSLVHVDQVGFPVTFQNCLFENNTSLENNEDTSAVAAFRFPTVFRGHNCFIRNIGGGITLLNTRMFAEDNGTILFDSNVAVFGGGIAMDDRCLLEVGPGVNMTFYNNTATESGGGIYVEFPPIRFVVDIFNRLCFMQFNDGSGTDYPPQDWTGVTIAFIENQARLSGAAIFASDMQQCRWLGNEFIGNVTTVIFDPPSELRNSNYPFQYNNNILMPEGESVTVLSDPNLATSPATIQVNVKYSQVQPGETLSINLLAVDQVMNSREAVWSLEAPEQDANLDALSAMNDTYPYNVPAKSILPDVTGDDSNFTSSFNLTFSLLRTLGDTTTVMLSVNGCHPGYTLSPSSQKCVCDTSNADILRCDDNKRYIYLREGIWGGVMMENGARKLVTARVQPGYINCTSQGRLPGCLFKFDDPGAQCRTGRDGRLCGECIQEYGVTLDLQSCTPISCNYGIGLFVAFCAVVIVVSTLLLALNISIPNELKGFFFYAQVIGLVYRPYVVVQSDSVSSVFSTLLNLLGISVPFPLCLSTEMKAHYVALFGYVSPILFLLPVIVYVIGARFINKLANHSTLKGLTFICLIVYKYTADTAAIFVSCNTTAYGFLFQYDGTQLCLSLEFGFFFFLGLLLVAFFVIPTPFAVGYVCVKRPKPFLHYSDVLTEGLRKEHRWWGGWDLGRRLLFVLIAFFVVFARPSLILFFMSLAALVVLIVHLFTKPFEKMYINVIEAAILLDLLMITVAFLDPSNSPVPMEFGLFLVVLPYAYAVGFLLYKLCSHCWNRMGNMIVTKVKKQPEDTASGDANLTHFGERETASNRTTPIPISLSKNGLDQTQDTGASPGSSSVPTRQTLMSPDEDRNVALREPLLEDEGRT